jgi:hypothetical protein
MLAFYWNYFAREHRRRIRDSLCAATVFVAGCYLAILFDDTFYCGKNVSVQWLQEDGACSVFYAQTPFLLNFALSLACYLVIYAWPLIPLSRSGLGESTGLLLIFVMGGLAIASGGLRFACLKVGGRQENLVCKSPFLSGSGSSTYMFVCADILSMLEMTLSIVVVSASGLQPSRPLWR